MTSSAPHVRPATTADLTRMAQVLAGSFSQDPVFVRMLPQDLRRREDRLRHFFTLELPRSLAHGGAWVTDDGAGAAVWYPPGHWKPSLWQTLRQTPAMLRVLGRQASLAGQMLTAMQQHHPTTPHWYLLYVAVADGRQGSGVGTALLRPVLEHCDTDGLPAYLEATTKRNQALYRRLGFTDLPELILPGGGPVMSPMWRKPVRATPT
jgi:ribosomal protein S18 acetylase RimI-like enzyme